MKKGTSLLILLSIINFYTSKIIAQEISEPNFKKNGVYGSVGLSPFSATVNINYERLIANSKIFFFRRYYAHLGYGRYTASYNHSGSITNFSIKAISGKNKGHLEFGTGIAYLRDKTSYDEDIIIGNSNEPEYSEPEYENIVFPSLTLGYRFQKPEGHFIFRAGVSFPNGIYISLGVAF